MSHGFDRSISMLGAGNDSGVIDTVYTKVTRRLIPFLFLCYVVSYLDRINVGFAKLQMQQALDFSDAVYGLGAGIFFLGYFIFEVPSNLLIRRVGVRKTMARIMVLWGITGTCTALVSTPEQFYVLRFLLGVFEAGFFPGVVYYLSYWYPEKKRGAVLGIFMTGIPIAGLLGGPISGLAMERLEGVLGWQGWQWLFAVEAAPAVLLGIIAVLYIEDEPQGAKWLSNREKQVIADTMNQDKANSAGQTSRSFAMVLSDARVYLMALAYFTFICGTYALSFWLPTLLKQAGIKSISEIGAYSAIPFGISAIGMVLLTRKSDRMGERRWHTAICAIVGAGAFILMPSIPVGIKPALLVLTVAAISIFSTMPLFWAIASDFFAGAPAAAPGIALINSIGLIGGFVSPSIMGWIKTQTGYLDYGLYLVAALMLVGAMILICGVRTHSSRPS